ncbi:hypothetical protein Hokovirus_1_238 [Hokovirus HKV1]|uniref:Uncharacterized protein n=1 Tax=Hokovirus HKV1 TaxID=1977638 RepID=A0A1V0SF55_9VIRU|nr:hypothetical protein Hokovirus_1_238 [Hokovirus HKV1]
MFPINVTREGGQILAVIFAREEDTEACVKSLKAFGEGFMTYEYETHKCTTSSLDTFKVCSVSCVNATYYIQKSQGSKMFVILRYNHVWKSRCLINLNSYDKFLKSIKKTCNGSFDVYHCRELITRDTFDKFIDKLGLEKLYALEIE